MTISQIPKPMSKPLPDDGRTHVRSGLMRESLVSRKLLEQTDGETVKGMVPDVKLVAIGGRSIMDRGAEAILPLIEMIVAQRPRHRMVIGVGGGARARHTYAIGLDLGLPVGGLARIVGGVEENNRDILQFLLAPHGGITLIKEHFRDLQLFLNNGMIPVCIGQPPYHFWEPPPRDGAGIPDNGPDVGLYQMAEIIGAEQFILVKDVDGVYTDNPVRNPKATLIREITTRDLLARDLPDLPIERELLHTLENARTVRHVQVINGLKPDNLRRALEGEHVGTIIRSSRSRA